jgi:uncharacterized integral membrane protein (TIGR00697 family)
MNEILFFLHVLAIFLFTLGALRLGKETLSTWVCLQALFANFFVLKQVNLWGCQITASDVFAVGGILGLNLLQEFYGKETAKKVTLTSLYCLLAFALLSMIHLLYIPSIDDRAHIAYKALLAPAPRLFIASISVFFFVQYLDRTVFNALRSRFTKSSFSLRNFCSLSLSQCIDTVLFSFLGLYGLVTSLFDIIWVSFLTKMIIILLLSPLSLMIKGKIIPKDCI